jgi:flavodoxin
MQCAVLYDSETGNTKQVAERIYEAIDTADKELIDLKEEAQIPQADLYFVGFPIHQKNCGMRIVDALEEISCGKFALFATCGMNSTEKYKQKLEDSLSIWLPDQAEYMGMFLCQGKTTAEQKNIFCNSNPEYRDKIAGMLQEGDSHPNEEDFDDAVTFAKEIWRYCN